MSTRIKLNPRIAYFLGLFEYSYSNDSPEPIIGIVSKEKEIVEEFIDIAINEFKIEPNKILLEHNKDLNKVYFYNSKLKKLIKRELERKSHIFKYKNNYSANYFKGIYNASGGINKNGVYINRLKTDDALIMEKLGFHTMQRGSNSYVINKNTFLNFIKI